MRRIDANERIGMTNTAANGMKMTIIAYRNAADIDIQFEDNVVVTNKRYTSFCQGCIKHPDKTAQKRENRLYEKKQNIMGEWMTIIRYKNAKDMDIQFEDGTIVNHREYKSFQKGDLHNPNSIRSTNQQKKWLHKTGIVKQTGEKMTIVEYKNSSSVTVEFETTKTKQHITLDSFKKGAVYNPDYQYHLGETSINTQGSVMKIIKKIPHEDLYVIQFDNKYISDKLYHYASFLKGQIYNPKMPNKNIGHINRMKNGLLAKIIAVTYSTDIDVLFEDNTLVKHISISQFNKGFVPHPNITISKANKYYGYVIQRVLCMEDNVSLYSCTDKSGNTSLMTLQELLDKENIPRLDFSANNTENTAS